MKSYASVPNADAGTNATQAIDYTYDAEDQRVKRAYDADGGVPNFASEYFVYDGDDLSMRFGNAQELSHRYLYGPQTDQVLVDEVFKTVGSQQVSDEVLWQLADGQGTIRDIIDANGTLRKHVDYDSFGKITGESYFDTNGNSISNPATNPAAVDELFGYTGQEWDKDAKLYNYNARWYDPQMGRFLSQDPSGFDGGDANLFRYVGNDPINNTDPTGLFQQGNPVQSLLGLGSAFGNVSYAAASTFLPGSTAAIPAFKAGVGFAAAGLASLPPSEPQPARPKDPVSESMGNIGSFFKTYLFDRPRSDARSFQNFVSETTNGTKILTDQATLNARSSPSAFGHGAANALNTAVSTTADAVNSTAYGMNLPVRVEDAYRSYTNQNVSSGAALALGFGQNLPIFSSFLTAEELYQGQGNKPGNLNRTLTQAERFEDGQSLTFDLQMAGFAIAAGMEESSRPGSRPNEVETHHLMTNKNSVSTAAGGPYTPEFERLAERRGITLNDAANKVQLPGHTGPHPEYNAEVYNQLSKATNGLKGEQYNKAFDQALDQVRKQTVTPGAKLNKLATGQRGS